MSSITNHKGLFLSLALLLALMMGTGLYLGNSVFAANNVSLPGSDFEIDKDANLIVDGDHGLTLDWEDADVANIRKDDEPSGSSDDSFGMGTKEDTELPSPVTGSIPPNKSDLKTFGVYVEDNASGKFVHMFWTRVQDPKGTTNMDFEFNQSDDVSDNGITKVRTDGDLLIEYKLSKGGTLPVLFRYLWIDASGSLTVSDCEAANKLPCWGDKVNLTTSGDATGSINTSLIGAGNSEGLGALDPFTFGEATVDFSSIFDPSSCLSFGSAYLKSRSSDSFTSALKDYIAPQPVNITNCGQVIIRKETDPTPNTTDSFGFTTTVVTDPANGSPFPLKDTESKTISNVLFGTNLTVTENDPGGLGFELTGIDCGASTAVTPSVDVPNRKITFDIDSADDIVDCTFTNKPFPDVNIVKKDDSDNPLAGAVFTLYNDLAPLGGAMLGNEDTITALTCQTNASGLCTISSVPPGQYWVVETTTPPGYQTAPEENIILVFGTDQTLNFENPHLNTVIVITCSDVPGNGLVVSDVRLDIDQPQDGLVGEPVTTTMSSTNLQNDVNTAIAGAGSLNALFNDLGNPNNVVLRDALEAFICRDLGTVAPTARYEGLPMGTYDADVDIP